MLQNNNNNAANTVTTEEIPNYDKAYDNLLGYRFPKRNCLHVYRHDLMSH